MNGSFISHFTIVIDLVVELRHVSFQQCFSVLAFNLILYLWISVISINLNLDLDFSISSKNSEVKLRLIRWPYLSD